VERKFSNESKSEKLTGRQPGGYKRAVLVGKGGVRDVSPSESSSESSKEPSSESSSKCQAGRQGYRA
jgi:hypothetical protein